MNRFLTRPLIFISVSTMTALFLSTFWGFLTHDIAFLSLAAGGLGWVCSPARSEALPDGNVPGSRLCDILTFAAFLIGAPYVLSIYYPEHSQGVSFEMAQHRIPAFISSVMSFTSEAVFWPQNPVLAVGRYHDFGFSLFTALPLQLNVSLLVILPLLGILLLTLFVLMLRLWAAEAALGSFLFMSGTAGYVLLMAVRSAPYRSYLNLETVMPGAMGVFSFVSDPSLWYAYPAALALLWSFREKFAENRPGLSRFEDIMIWASLPVFNLTIFCWVTLLGFYWCACSRQWKTGWRILMPGGLFALLLVGCLSGFSGWPDFFLRPRLQSMFREEKGFFQYSFQYGALLVWMMITAGFSLRPERRKNALFFLIPGAATFLFFTIFNITGVVNEGLPAAFLGLLLVAVCFQKHLLEPLGPVLRGALLCAMFLPGLWIHTDPRLDYLRNKKNLHQLQEVEEVCSAVSGLAKGYRIASTMQTYHPLAFCGAPVATIFNDVFFVQDSPQRRNSEKVRKILAGGPGWYEAARELNVRYVFWGKLELQDFGHFSKKPWELRARKIREGSWGALYDLGVPSALGPEPSEGEGLRVRVFNNPDAFGDFLFERNVVTVDFDWKEDAAKDFLVSPYALVFEGELNIPVSGEVDFFLASDDGSRLEIGGEILIDNSGNHPLRIKQAHRYFDAGWYPFRLHYDESWGVSAVHLWWKLPSQSEEVISPDHFRPAPAEPASS